MFTGYRKRILEVFASAFPLSAHYHAGRSLRKGEWDRIFPEITGDVEARENFLDAVDALCKEGVLTARWKRFREGDTLLALYLANPEKLYALLGKSHPDATRELLLAELKVRCTKTDLEAALTAYCIQMLENKQPLLPVQAAELPAILDLAACDPLAAARCSLRNLSIRLFHDSKRIEQIIKSADTLCQRVCGERLSAKLGLFRAYPESTIAGHCRLMFKDGSCWELKGKTATLPYATLTGLKEIQWNDSNPRVLSIENKETFYLAAGQVQGFSGFLYTSGQLNTADQVLLKQTAASGACLWHYGDHDPGGIIIFRSLYNLLDGQLRPWLMDTATYDAYLAYGYLLEPTALKKIRSMDFPPLQPLLNRICETGKGVEQEIINLPEIFS